jgi:hypothetical protein
LLAGISRLVIAVGGGWLALRLTGSLNSVFAMLGLGLFVFGVMIATAIRCGAWERGHDRSAKSG